MRLGSSWCAAPSRDDPLRGGVALLDRDGVARFGRAVVLDEDDRGAGADGKLADEPVVRVGVAEHPAAAVHVEDRGQRARGIGRPDDADAHVAHLGGDGDPALVDRQLLDRLGLDVVQYLARLVRRELVDERRRRGRVDELLRCRLEHDRSGGGDG